MRRLGPYLAPARPAAGVLPAEGGLEVGPGDDAAVWAPPPGCEVVVTTDSLVEGVHFAPPESESEARDLGWKLLAVSLSDLAAMGADAGPAFLALALPAGWPVAWLDALYAGLRDCAVAHGAELAGGNLSGAPAAVLTSTCLGSVPAGAALRRDGAVPGWELALTGRVGGAAAGLRDARWRARQVHPTPRLAAGRVLREAGVGVALDVSDGLWLDAARLLGDASTGASEPARGASGLVIDWAAVPVEPGIGDRWPEEAISLAGGGEDYELLFAAPPALIREAVSRLAARGIEAAVIGVFDAGAGVRLLVAGAEIPPPASGHVHFGSRPGSRG